MRAERVDCVRRPRVNDNGQGIHDDQPEQMFRLFARGSFHVGGKGIGLTTVRRVKELHRGTVAIDDGPDGGRGVRAPPPEYSPEQLERRERPEQVIAT